MTTTLPKLTRGASIMSDLMTADPALIAMNPNAQRERLVRRLGVSRSVAARWVRAHADYTRAMRAWALALPTVAPPRVHVPTPTPANVPTVPTVAPVARWTVAAAAVAAAFVGPLTFLAGLV